MPARLDELSVFPFSRSSVKAGAILPAHPPIVRSIAWLKRLSFFTASISTLIISPVLASREINFGTRGSLSMMVRRMRSFTGDLQIKLARDVCQRRDAVGAGFVLGDKDRDFEKDIEKPVKRFSLLGGRENAVVEFGHDKRLPGRDVLLQVIHNPLLGGEICLCDHRTNGQQRAEGPARISGKVCSVPQISWGQSPLIGLLCFVCIISKRFSGIARYGCKIFRAGPTGIRI